MLTGKLPYSYNNHVHFRNSQYVAIDSLWLGFKFYDVHINVIVMFNKNVYEPSAILCSI